MNIGIDLDGVIYDSEEFYRFYAYWDNVTKFKGKKLDHVKDKRMQNAYEWTDEQFSDYMIRRLPEIQEMARVKFGASEILQSLKEMGHKLYIVTARGITYDFEIDVTMKRLPELNVDFDGMFFSAVDKVKVCKENGIDIMIDDYDANVMQLASGGVKTLYFRDVYSDDIVHDNVTTVYNWGDIHEYFVKNS